MRVDIEEILWSPRRLLYPAQIIDLSNHDRDTVEVHTARAAAQNSVTGIPSG